MLALAQPRGCKVKFMGFDLTLYLGKAENKCALILLHIQGKMRKLK